MKRSILIIVFALTLASKEENIMARGLITGDKSIELSFAAADLCGISADFRYASLVKPRMEIGFSISGLGRIYEKDIYQIPIIQASAAFDFSHILFSAKRSTLALWIDAHVLLGYESVNMENRHFDDGAELLSRSSFIWGGMVALRFEIPLSSRTALSLKARERYLPTSNVSAFHSELGIGIRIKL